MVLTEELYDIGKNSKEVCTIIDDDYVLVTKSMPVTDEKIDDYIEAIRKAKKSGINIATILDYRIIPGTTSSYCNGTINYSKGVFLEERAKGKSLEGYCLYYDSNKDSDIENFAISYIKKLDEYTKEMERRATGKQEYYDKLVSDCLRVKKFGIEIDPKPLNFFYEENVGFTIIDVIADYGNNLGSVSPYFARYIFGIVFGYGRPVAIVDSEIFKGIPKEYSSRLINAYQVIYDKIVLALRKAKISESYITKALNDSIVSEVGTLNMITELEDIETVLSSMVKKDKPKLTGTITVGI